MKYLILIAVCSLSLLSFAQEMKCDVSRQAKARRLLSLEGRAWQKYTKSRAESGADTVEVASVLTGKEMLVEIDSDTASDTFTYQKLCYDSSGKLIRSNYELRTAWGWAIKEGPDNTYYFDVKTGKAIATPTEPMDGAELAKHKRYMTVRELPSHSY